MNSSLITRALVAWHADHARDLPWRDRPAGQRDAYRVWISEIMAQQTRLETVVGYFARWLAAFPTVEALAAANQQEVLKLWEGMGYYARARNLHRAAQIVVEQHGGVIPSERRALLALPGIGEYTVGAILSMAFGQAEPILDGNVKRVLSRVADIEQPIDERATLKQMWSLARELVEAAPVGEAGAFNEALMELGNRLCTPTNPRCLICPINQHCLAASRGTQHERPVLPPKKSTPHYDVVAGVIWRGEPFASPLLVAQRPQDKMLGGLWEFPGGKVEPGDADLAAALRREIAEELGIEIEVAEPVRADAAPLAIAHAYTHFRITLYPLHARWIATDSAREPRAIGCADWLWLGLDELDALPFPKTDWQIIHALRAEAGMQ